jgi:hypothetical protein
MPLLSKPLGSAVNFISEAFSHSQYQQDLECLGYIFILLNCLPMPMSCRMIYRALERLQKDLMSFRGLSCMGGRCMWAHLRAVLRRCKLLYLHQ